MENWLLKRFDGALPISDQLVAYYSEIAPSKPNMKVPIVCDYDRFAEVKRTPSEPYFLYCGSDSFIDVAEFILKAFEEMDNNDEVKLYLLISGILKNKIDHFQRKINHMFPFKEVILFSNVPYQQLMQLFTNAKALLIPLRRTIEDSARFPHKIGEYLATGNPIITTNVGEINTYFEDGINALVTNEYQVKEFAKKMDYVIYQYDHAQKIGLRGKELGLRQFHYKAYGVKIREFLMNL